MADDKASLKVLYQQIYGSQKDMPQNLDEAQYQYDLQAKEVFELDKKFDEGCRGLELGAWSADDLKKAGRKLYEAQEELKRLDIICSDFRGFKIENQ